jgi:hypothetical protein
MSVNDASRIIINDSRVTIQIEASLADDSWGIIYNHNIFIVQATGVNILKKCQNNKVLVTIIDI